MSGAALAQERIERLTDPSWAVRRGLISALGDMGDVAVGPLCAALRDRRDDETRIAAVMDALVASRGDVDPSLLELAERAPAPAILCDALNVLGRRRSAEAVPLLVRLVDAADDNVAMVAIEALGRVGGAAAVDSLVKVIESGNFFRAFPAIDVLGRSGDPRSIPALQKLLDHALLAPEAARALGRGGDASSIPFLARILGRGADPLVRVAATALLDLHDRHLARFGSGDRVEALVRTSVEPGATSHRIAQALQGADVAEQVALCRLLGWLGDPGASAALMRVLEGDPAVSTAAREALHRLGQEADSRLLEELAAADSGRRAALLPHVGGRAAGLAPLLACLEDADPAVRTLACEALARGGASAAVVPLFKHLADPDLRVRRASVAALQAIGGAETERLAIEAARSADVEVRRAALRILAYFAYPTALEALVAAARDPDERVREAAIVGLAFLDDPRARTALDDAARHESPRTRAAAMRALGQLAGGPPVVDILAAGLRDPDAWVRYYACQALGRRAESSVADRIVALTADPAPQVRIAAVDALAHLRGEKALAALHAASAADEPDLRRAALVGLGVRRDPAALPRLLEAVDSGDPATRLIAISALAGFDSAAVLSALARAAVDADAAVREAAIGHLASRAGAGATRVLVGLLANDELRDRAIDALATFTEGRVDQLLVTVSSAGEALAPALIAALARMHRPEARAAIARALETGGAAARRAAAAALAAVRTPQGTAALERAARDDADPEVRRISSEALVR